MEKLVPLYQQGDALAAEAICQGFTPLVRRLAHRQYVYNSYGEDAENMLWLWLLEFLKTYHGNNFRMLPGLIRRHLVCKLMRSAECNSRRWSVEQTTDLSDGSQNNLVENNDVLQKEVLALAIKQELKLLPPKQKEVICRYYLEQESQGDIAASVHCTTRAVRLHLNAALKTLREHFLQG